VHYRGRRPGLQARFRSDRILRDRAARKLVPTSRKPAVKAIVYADFSCLHCYPASQRADRLARTGTAQVDWRAVEHDRRLPVTGSGPTRPRSGWAGEVAAAAARALPGERLPAGPPSVVSNTAASVAAYAEAVSDGVQDELRRRLFDAIWAQGRNMSSAYDVRRVVLNVMWPADPIYPHQLSPDLPVPIVHDPDLNRIVRREGGIITPDGGPLTTDG
jgi:DSBA-like thioredoxin domain